jgi:hypothetical protein
MTKQPVWKYIDNLSDADPIENGGLFLYEDETGVYAPELEKLEEPCDDARGDDDEDKRWTVRRVCLGKLKLVRKEDTLYLVPGAYEAEWSHPVTSYVEWFAEDLGSVAETMSTTREELEVALCGDDIKARAWAYQCIYDYNGWDNGDSYPCTLTRAEVEARYAKELAS